MADDRPRTNLAGCVEDAHAAEHNDLEILDDTIATTDDPKGHADARGARGARSRAPGCSG